MSSTKNQQPYFPHYGNSRNEDNMIRLRMTHGVAGYGVYYMLLERLRLSDGYRCELDYEILCFDLDCSEDLIRSVIYDFGLFEIVSDGQMFTSVELNEYMQLMEQKKRERQERARAAAAARWGNSIVPSETTQVEPKEDQREKCVDNDIIENTTERLDKEMEVMEADETWLAEMSAECGKSTAEILSFIPDFRKRCLLSGLKNGHKDMKDTLTHFRSWIYKSGRAKDPNAIRTNTSGMDRKRGRLNERETEALKRLDRQLEERNARWEEFEKKKTDPRTYIKNKGYDPDTVTMVQIMRPDWCKNNPPTHPEWIGAFSTEAVSI